MTHEAYSTKRVTVWDEERDGIPGKAILYQDGYQSWCPNDVYERDYRSVDGELSFGQAIHALKGGARVCRRGWNGKGMWLVFVDTNEYTVDCTGPRRDPFYPEPLPWIGMKTADNKFVPWLPSQTDMLADDWMILYGTELQVAA